MAEIVNFPQDFIQIAPSDAASQGYDLLVATETARKKIFVGSFLTAAESYTSSLFTELSARVGALETQIANLPQAGAVSGLRGWDTTRCKYKNVLTITIFAGGQYTCNGLVHNITEDIDLSLATDLTVDDFDSVANTWYHVIANGDVMKLATATSASDVPGGVCLRVGCSLDSSGDIRMFVDDGLWYRYAHNAILLHNDTMPISNKAISLAAYVPAVVRRAELRSAGAGLYDVDNVSDGANVYINDIAASAGTVIYHSAWIGVACGIFQASTGRSMSFRCAYAYPSGKLWLQGWRK